MVASWALALQRLVHQPLPTLLETTQEGMTQSFPLMDHWWDSGTQIFPGA